MEHGNLDGILSTLPGGLLEKPKWSSQGVVGFSMISIKSRPGPPGPPGPSQLPLDLHEIPGVRLDHLPIRMIKACQSYKSTETIQL